MTGTRKKILIVAVNWMGDLLFMTPAIRAIRRAHPESHIACLVAPRGVELLSGNPHLDAVIPLEERRGLAGFLRWSPLIRRLKGERFDAAYLFHRSFTRTLIAWAAGIRHRIGYRTWKRGWLLTHSADPPRKDSVHKAVWFLKMLEADGIVPDGMGYDAGILREEEERAASLLREWGILPEDQLVALHAGANWKLKRWPLAHFAALADALADRWGAKVLFVGDKGDLPLTREIAGRMKSRPILAAGKTSFRELGAVLKRANLLISNDSGPLHMGLAAGTPVVALFGPTDPKLTGPPQGSRGATLFGSIGCPVPCYQLRCPLNLCMQQITVEEVLAAVQPFLAR
ncbi:MAG: lipopolysaccharide heptosyltransferase II [Candidatus Omnitrophica bacterium]|nr:lipopolysaccharide heptosyltransferase II [Candidatus Omnitrophota bacterium]